MFNQVVAMNNIRDEMINILGENKFNIFVDNNGHLFNEIQKGERMDTQVQKLFDGRIVGLLTSSAGELVALKDLFSTSFGFVLAFFVPVDQNIDKELNKLSQALNGRLNTVGDSRFLMTFSTPSAFGGVNIMSGPKGAVFYQQVVVSGNIAITNDSMFGNELKITISNGSNWNNVDLSRMLITAEPTLNMEMTPSGVEAGGLIPQFDYLQANNAISLMLHMRRSDALTMQLFDYLFNPNGLVDFTLKFYLFKDITEDPNYTWSGCKVLSILPLFTTGGYVIMNVSFQRSEAIE